MRKKAILELFWVPAILTSVCAPTFAQSQSNSPPRLFWPQPVRAHPGVPLVFTLVAYDVEHDPLQFFLENAPAGMSIDGLGTIRWNPTEVEVSPTPLPITAVIDDGAGGITRQTFSLVVGRDPFIFVSPGGSDSAGTGKIDSPFQTIDRGLQALKSSNGATLFLRGGEYQVAWNWDVGGVRGPLSDKYFSAGSPAEIRAFPGEKVVIDCQYRGHGLWALRNSYILMADLEIKNARGGDRGGAIAKESNHIVFQNITVHHSNWPAQDNCTGFLLIGQEIVAHRCNAYDNSDGTDFWNNSNYLVYADQDSSDIYILDSVSRGNTVVGYKIKHPGNGQLILHGNYEQGSRYGFGGADSSSTVRYNTFVDNTYGIYLGMSDPHPQHTDAPMQVERNTVVNAQLALAIQSGYLRTAALGVFRNIFFTTKILGRTETDPHLYFLWPYDDSAGNGLSSDTNCFSASSADAGFRWGRNPARSYADWRRTGQDASSFWADPLFLNPEHGDYRPQPGSPCTAMGANSQPPPASLDPASTFDHSSGATTATPAAKAVISSSGCSAGPSGPATCCLILILLGMGRRRPTIWGSGPG